MSPVIMICLCGLGQTSSAPSVDEVRQAMSAALGSIKTAEVIYVEDKSLPPPAPEEMRRLVSPQSISPDEDRAVNARLTELSKTSHMKVTLNLDAQGGVWRITTKDLRDLNAIMEKENFAPDVRGYLDQSCVLLADRDLQGWFGTGIGWLSTHESAKPFASPVVNSDLRVGAVPDEMFQRSSGTSIVASGAPPDQLFRLTVEWPNGGKVVLEVDPKIGYRYRSYRAYRSDGKLGQLEEASDYRLVDGLYLPFRYEVNSYDSTGTTIRQKKIVVQEAHFNRKLPSGSLQMVLTPGTRISAARRGAVPPRIEEMQVLGINELKALHGPPTSSQPQ